MKKESVDKMIEESKAQLNNENLSDKQKYVIEHKLDCLTRVNY